MNGVLAIDESFATNDVLFRIRWIRCATYNLRWSAAKNRFCRQLYPRRVRSNSYFRRNEHGRNKVSKNCASPNALPTVQHLIECASFHHLRLARIFKAFRVGSKLKVSVLSFPFFSKCDGGNKLAMVECKSWMGADPRHIDTEMSECFHKVVVERAYAANSKRD